MVFQTLSEIGHRITQGSIKLFRRGSSGDRQPLAIDLIPFPFKNGPDPFVGFRVNQSVADRPLLRAQTPVGTSRRRPNRDALKPANRPHSLSLSCQMCAPNRFLKAPYVDSFDTSSTDPAIHIGEPRAN
jgi:hypothetical protein